MDSRARPVDRRLPGYVVPTLVALALLVGGLLTTGYRNVAAPVGADFEFVVAMPDGIRLFGFEAERYDQTSLGWRACGGEVEAEVERSGDELVLRLTHHPRPQPWPCSLDEEPSGNVQYDSGFLIPLDGPPPSTVRVPGGSDVYPVLDTMVGPGPPGTEWEQSVNYMSFQGSFPGTSEPAALSTTWHTSRARIHVAYPAPHVGDAADWWLREGDLGADPNFRESPPRTAPPFRFQLGGVELKARFQVGEGAATQVRVTTQGDHRTVLRLSIDEMTMAEVRDVLREVRVTG